MYVAPAGGSESHNNMRPYMALHAIICVEDIGCDKYVQK